LASLSDELKAINKSLWKIEDAIRRHEAEGDFGAKFIELARPGKGGQARLLSIRKAAQNRACLSRVRQRPPLFGIPVPLRFGACLVSPSLNPGDFMA